MATITLELDDELARQIQEAARREHKSVAEWVRERLIFGGADGRTRLETLALANGYPPNWPTLYASLAEDDAFAAPPRSASRGVTGLE
jgi:hypothetical protein